MKKESERNPDDGFVWSDKPEEERRRENEEFKARVEKARKAAINGKKGKSNGRTSRKPEKTPQPAPQPTADTPRMQRLHTTCAADVKVKPLHWLVPDILPLGKLVLLAGDGGMGKSTITIDLAARLSRGERAFGLDYKAIAGNTLIASCEDDPSDTLVPRLLAAGADLTRVHLLNGINGTDGPPAPWSLAHHGALDHHLAANPNIRLVIIDPASAFAGLAGIDGHKDAELRALLGPLTAVAARYEVTTLLVAHLGKNETIKAVRRVLGSVAWVNAVRAAWIVAEREEDAGKRLFLPVKANLAPKRRGLFYQLIPLSESDQELALAGCSDLEMDDRQRLKQQLYRVVWLGETDAEPDQVFAAASRRPDSPSDIKRAADWLKQYLQDGPVESTECVEKGNAALGLHRPLKWWRDTILKGELHGKPQKGTGFQSGWLWGLPDSLDSLDSLDETREKQEAPPPVTSEEQGEKPEKRSKNPKNPKKPNSQAGWTAPDADPDALQTPFDEENDQ